MNDRDEFQQRLERLDAQWRTVRRVFASLLFLILVAVVSSLVYRISGVVFHPKPRTERTSGYRVASIPAESPRHLLTDSRDLPA